LSMFNSKWSDITFLKHLGKSAIFPYHVRRSSSLRLSGLILINLQL
jgi:hypothetical protein